MKDGTALPGWPLLLRPELAAAYLGMARSTFDRAVKEGDLPRPIATVFSLHQWHRADLEAWVEKRRAAAEPPPAASPGNPWDDAV